MARDPDVALSKRLSLALRHCPADFGLALDAAGWADVEAVLNALACDRARLERVVATSDKKRFELSEDGRRVRAVQGHSVPVDLGHAAAVPPDVLYHGTTRAAVASILAEGLRRGARHDVHLSATVETARRVGARHGPPVILVVDARAMASAGHVFRVAPNGVWLAEHVPPEFLRVLGEPERVED